MENNLIPGEIAEYKYGANGILYSYSKSVTRTVKNIGGNIALVKQITNGRKVPILVYLCKSPVPDKDTRRFSTQQLPLVYTAMAMVSKPGLSSLIMRLLFQLKTPPIPMKSFTDAHLAEEWLLQYVIE